MENRRPGLVAHLYCCGPGLAGHDPQPSPGWAIGINHSVLGPYPVDCWALLDAEPFLEVKERVGAQEWNRLRATTRILTHPGWIEVLESKGGSADGWLIDIIGKPLCGSTVVTTLTWLSRLTGFRRIELYGAPMKGREYYGTRIMRNQDWYVRNRWAKERRAVADLMWTGHERGTRIYRVK